MSALWLCKDKSPQSMVRLNNPSQMGESKKSPCLLLFLNSFLEGSKATLVASKDFNNSHYKTTPQHGVCAFGCVYSAWAYGQTIILFFKNTCSIDIFSHLIYFHIVVQRISVPSQWMVMQNYYFLSEFMLNIQM